MIGFLHGYFLDGSGSGIWTRQMVEALCRLGEDVLLVCQDPRFDSYSFVAKAYVHSADGKTATALDRATPFPGTCHLHKIAIGSRIPVFIEDHYEGFAAAVPVTDLTPREWKAYEDAHVKVLEPLTRQAGVDCWLVNHAGLLAVAAKSLKEKTRVPYVVVPHGSDLEYAIRRSEPFREHLRPALNEADGLVIVSPEIESRLRSLFPNESWVSKLKVLSVGVDTHVFHPVAPKERARAVRETAAALKALPWGKDAATDLPASGLLSRLPKAEAYLGWLHGNGAYEGKRAERGAGDALERLRPAEHPTLAFAGRLIAAKGFQLVAAALPLLWQIVPSLRVLVVGHGPLREVAELLLAALKAGNVPWVEGIAQWASPTEPDAGRPYFGLHEFFRSLKEEGTWDPYLEAATRMPIDQLAYLGYLDHSALARVLPLAAATAIPSVVPEAGPMALLEAAACGSFPLGTDQGGMASNLARLFDGTQSAARAAGRLHPDPARLARDLIVKVPEALQLAPFTSSLLRANTVRHYDWSSLATRLLGLLSVIRPHRAA